MSVGILMKCMLFWSSNQNTFLILLFQSSPLFSSASLLPNASLHDSTWLSCAHAWTRGSHTLPDYVVFWFFVMFMLFYLFCFSFLFLLLYYVGYSLLVSFNLVMKTFAIGVSSSYSTAPIWNTIVDNASL
jgi:hypothetical protein